MTILAIHPALQALLPDILSRRSDIERARSVPRDLFEQIRRTGNVQPRRAARDRRL